MLLAMVIWSAVCVATFLFALRTNSRDYRTFFRHLLGPLWPAFEVAYFPAVVLVLAVYAAAAGAIGQAIFAWPQFVGSLCLVISIALVATWGNEAVERLFKYVSFFLYATYALFVILVTDPFRRTDSFRTSRRLTSIRVDDWRSGLRGIQHHWRHRYLAGSSSPGQREGRSRVIPH